MILSLDSLVKEGMHVSLGYLIQCQWKSLTAFCKEVHDGLYVDSEQISEQVSVLVHIEGKSLVTK